MSKKQQNPLQSFRRRRDLGSVLLASAVASVLPISSYAQEPAQDMVLEEVVVTGIRASMAAAADLKENSDQIGDSIVAEDIGKLPDNNIAEALQRVTGVSINRDFGVGSEVSIRGLPQNRVELNGRSTVGDGRNGVSFEDFPASFLSAVEVIKSPTPEMIEGALGGTISLKTAKPLDLPERLFAVSMDGEYADKSEEWAPVFSIAGGENWDFGEAGTFGVMGLFAYQDRTLRQDTHQASLFVFNQEDINNLNVDAQNTPSGDYVVATEHKFEPFIEERERKAYNLILQWAPASEAGNIYLDVNATEREGGQEAYSILYAGGDPSDPDLNPSATGGTFEDRNGALQNYRYEGVVVIPKTWSEFRETDSTSIAFGGDWNFFDKLTVAAEFSTAESNSVQPKSEFNWRAVDPVAEALDPEATNEFNPSVDIVNSQTEGPSVVFVGGNPFLNTDVLAFREYLYSKPKIDNKEDAFRLDVEYNEPGGLEWITAIKAGFRVTENEFESRESQYRVRDLYRYLDDENGNRDIIWQDEIAAAFPGSIIIPDVTGDAFEHAGQVGPSDLTRFSVYDGNQLQNAEQTFERVQQLVGGKQLRDADGNITPLSTLGTLDENLEDLNSAFALVTEDTTAYYLQANMDFETVRFVIGARFVETEISSTAFNQAGDQLVTEDSRYVDFLPSFNATVNLTDSTLMRFAGAKVMARPNFEQLSPTFVFASDFVTADKGNPGLDPFRATQFDIAFEHYFGEGDLISTTFFYKSVASFLKSETFCAFDPEALSQQNLTIPTRICIRPEATGDSSTWTFASGDAELAAFSAEGRRGVLTNTTANGSSGVVQGFEIGYQQGFYFLPGFWSGFGINANYTFSESEDPDGSPLADISENSYNFQLYWEYESFQVRLAYTFRDNFLDENNEKRTERVGELVAFNNPDIVDPTAGNDFRDDLEQWDLSGSWDVNDIFSVVANVSNLTAEPTVNYAANGTTWEVQESDRRFVVGVRAKF